MRFKILTPAVFLLSLFTVASLTIAGESSEEVNNYLQRKVIVKELIKDHNGAMTILTDNEEKLKWIDPKDRELTALITVGDRVKVDVDSQNPDVIKELKALERPIFKLHRSLALGAAFSAIFVLATLAAGLKPFGYIVGADNRYSNSKLQMVLWFSALMTVYLATLGLRVMIWGWDFLGGVGLTENLLSLSGFSILTYGAAKAITQQQANTLVNPLAIASKAQLIEEKNINPSIAKDFFRNNDGKLDLGDTQMFFISLLVVIIFLLLSFQFLGWIAYEKKIALPDIDTTLLAVFGLGQGAYLIKKASTPLGKG